MASTFQPRSDESVYLGPTYDGPMTGAQILVRSLIEQGVDMVFGYPGGTVIDIYDALYDAQDLIMHVETTHEQHACHAADGYARSTGRCGVVLATSGPGATNLVTGIATAYLDSIPLVAITGNVSREVIGTDGFQELDITGVTLPITKQNYFVRDVNRLQEVLHEAFELAMSDRKGPVLVDIPKDVQTAVATYCPWDPARPTAPIRPSQDSLQAAADAINASKRPFVYFGGGVSSAEAGDLVVQLAQRIGAPLGCSLMGISAIPTDAPGFLGMEGMHGHFACTKAMSQTDCLIAVGCRFNDRSTGERSSFAPNGKVVRIDLDSSEFSKTVEDQVDVHGDARVSLEALLPLVRPNTHESWRRTVRELKAQERGYADYRETLTPANIMKSINDLRPSSWPVVTDVGQHQMWAAQYLTFDEPRTFITSGGLGTMGFGLGAALGAALATGNHAILVTGDGSFAMNMAEVMTASQLGLPITVVLLNNGTLGMVRQMQSLFKHQRYSQTTLDRPVDYVDLARALGAKAQRVQTPVDFRQALGQALETHGPVLIECPVDKDEFVTPVLQIGASMDQLIVNMDDVKARMGR